MFLVLILLSAPVPVGVVLVLTCGRREAYWLVLGSLGGGESNRGGDLVVVYSSGELRSKTSTSSLYISS